MLDVIYTVPPSPEQFFAVIYGMRHAFKSYDKSDSDLVFRVGYTHVNAKAEEIIKPDFYFGDRDKQLALNLIRAGNPSHRKFLRQLPIILEIRAPEYWYKQLDAYKVGITMNSQSQMHNLVSKPFELSDFSFDMDLAKTVEIYNIDRDFPYDPPIHPDLDIPGWYKLRDGDYENTIPKPIEYLFTNYLDNLNVLRKEYLDTKDDRFWKLINFMLPQSYNYTRTVSMNYEVAMQIIEQRRGHKLGEWETLINELLKLPYMREFAEAAGLLND